MGSSCYSRGNKDNLTKMRDFVCRNNLQADILLKGCRCGNCCSEGPNIWVEDKLYTGLTDDKIDAFLEMLRETL